MKKIFYIALLVFCSFNFSWAFVDDSGFQEYDQYNPVSVALFNVSSIDIDEYKQGGEQLFTYTYVGVQYKPGYDWSFGLKVPFIVRSAGFEDCYQDDCVREFQETKFEMHDPYFEIKRYDLAHLPGDISSDINFRIKLPFSRKAVEQRRFTTLFSRITFSKDLGRGFSIGYRYEPEYHFVRQKSIVKLSTGSVVGADRFEQAHIIDFSYRYRKIGASINVGTESKASYASDANDKDRFYSRSISFGPQIGYYGMNFWVIMGLGFSQQLESRVGDNDYIVGRDDSFFVDDPFQEMSSDKMQLTVSSYWRL